MKAALLSSRSAFVFLLTASISACFAAAFSPTIQLKSTATKNVVIGTNKLFLQPRAQKIVKPSSVHWRHRKTIIFPSTSKLHSAEDNNTENANNIDQSRVIANDLGLDIIRGTGLDNADEIPEQTWEEIEQSAPSKLMVVKNVSLHFFVCNYLMCVDSEERFVLSVDIFIEGLLLTHYLIQTQSVHKHSF